MTRTMLVTRVAVGLAGMLAALVAQPAYAAGEPSLAVQTVALSAEVPASVAAVAAVDGEVCDSGQTYRSQVFRTDTKRVVYTFVVFVKKCAVGDLAYLQEIGADAVTPRVPDPIIYQSVGTTSLPGRPPQSIVNYESVVHVDACFTNVCQNYVHTFLGTATSAFQTGSFIFQRVP